MVGARISNLRELPAAYIRYELPRGRQAGLFIVDDPDGRFDAGGRDVEIGPRHARIINSRGYNTVVWRQDHTVYSLVSDSGEEDLIQMVRASAPEPEVAGSDPPPGGTSAIAPATPRAPPIRRGGF